MPATICAAHMHPLPCPGYDCRRTSDPTSISVMEEYRAKVEAGELPPWIWELRIALGSVWAWIRSQRGDEACTHRRPGHVAACIADLRRAGWTGEDRIIWDAGTSMSRFTGAMPWFPQRACEDREVQHWRELRDGGRG